MVVEWNWYQVTPFLCQEMNLTYQLQVALSPAFLDTGNNTVFFACRPQHLTCSQDRYLEDKLSEDRLA